jgi:pimeloyl-ACP methyl ester carboxylesterase
MIMGVMMPLQQIASRVRQSESRRRAAFLSHMVRQRAGGQTRRAVSTGRSSSRSRVVALVLAAGTIMGAGAAIAAPGVAAQTPGSSIRWAPCPKYSDAVARYLMGPAVPVGEFRRLLSRLECGTIRVPLDYRRPQSGSVKIALTRLTAIDPRRRIGALAVNPGGPGASGYLMPIQLVMSNSVDAKLNQRYDLIGFDPRGVGYSTKVACPGLSQSVPPPPGQLTERQAFAEYQVNAQENDKCGKAHRLFLAQLTTANVARDLNQIRIAIHQRQISFFGVSWGTALGAYYRSLFPATVSRMWLDSVLAPDFRQDAYARTNAQATATDFSRMTQWIARQNATYGFGATAQQVEAAIVKEWRQYDAAPRTFTHPNVTVGSALIAETAAQPSVGWPEAAQVLMQLRDATGPSAPPALRQIAGGQRSGPPRGVPETFDPTMGTAVVCNEDSGQRAFGPAWTAYKQLLKSYPVTGELISPTSAGGRCAGWPLPRQPWHLRAVSGSLELSGHRYESTTPYVWTEQMQHAIGGKIFTVNDDIHASLLDVPDCAAHMLAYFDTGKRDTGHCPGVPIPSRPGGSGSGSGSA